MPTPAQPISVRVATPDDLDAIVDTLTTAFFNDPMWGPVFPDVDRRASQMSTLWKLFAGSALRFDWSLVTQNVEAVALWIPPGESELTEDEESGFEDFLLELGGRSLADTVLAMFVQFDRVHPSEPHFYLSLLGTHERHRGQGLGMHLLRDNLARIDALGQPAYLESSNPANLARYASVGFRCRDELRMPAGPVGTSMWRPPVVP